LFANIFIPQKEVINGGVILIFSNQKPKYARIFNKTFPFFKTIHSKYKYYSLIPVSYYQKPATYPLKVVYKNSKEVANIKVKWGKYKKEKIKVSKKFASFNKAILKRIKREYKEAMAIYRRFDDRVLFSGKFNLPLSFVTSPYGIARVFNNKLKSYHSGIDFRAKLNTKIKAVNSGEVVLAKSRYFAGNSVVIYHGRGVYSCYYHLNRILVKRGDFVKKGEVIGLSGKSGRVSGPHLHFSMYLFGVAVNPTLLIKALNSL
jgi:murein DD-endopeptidase MepM/ murein hydrolase activator NlpD